MGSERGIISALICFKQFWSWWTWKRNQRHMEKILLGGALTKGRMVISENTLYGDPLLSVVSATHRLEMNQESKMAALWSMDESGYEAELLEDNLDLLAHSLFDYIKDVRGNVDVIQQVPGLSVPSQDAFQNLKKLGYIDEER